MRFAKAFLRGATLVAMGCCFAMSVRAQSWERIGPEGGNALSLAVLGNGEILLGTADGHVFASRDGGESWELRGRVGKRLDGVVQQLAPDSRMKTKAYVAMWTQDPVSGGGAFRSEDGGKTWASAGLQGEAVRALAQSASNPEVLVAGTRTGVFRSEDAGRNWERISRAGDEELKNLDSIAIDPHDANVIYVGTYHLPWKTTNAGKSWKPIAAGMIDDSDVMSIVIDAGNPEQIFASACSGIYRSENGGAQWTKLQGIPYVSRRTQQIAQDPLNPAVWYAGTTEGLWRSQDGGENWVRATRRDVVVNAIAFSGNGERLLLGTEDGILLSADGAKSFVARNAGFTHPVLRAFVVNEADPRNLLIAVERDGGGLQESTDEGKSWRIFPNLTPAANELFSAGGSWYLAQRGGGAAKFDFMKKKWGKLRFVVRETVRAPNKDGVPPRKLTRERLLKPDVTVISAAGGRLFAATSDGLWVSGLRSGAMQRVAEKEISGKVADFVASASGKQLLAIVRDRVGRTTDSGKTWDWVGGPENAGELLWVRPIDRDFKVVLIGTRKGAFEYHFEDAGEQKKDWKLLQSGLPATASWNPVLSETFWMIPMRAGGIYFSSDSGRYWQRWEVEGGGLAQSAFPARNSRVWIKTQTDGLFLLKIDEP